MSAYDDIEVGGDDGDDGGGVEVDVDGLAAVADLPVALRLRWLPYAHALLDADVAVSAAARAVACRVLGGCVGRGAVEALVDALDHKHPQVRLAAVQALAATASTTTKGRASHGARLLHAAAHPRTDVRRAALREDALPAQLLTLLLADERLHDEAAARLRERAKHEPEVGAVVVRARRQDLIDADVAAAALLALPWTKPASVLRALPVTKVPDAAVTTSPEALLQQAVGGYDDALVDVVVAVCGIDRAAVDGVAAALADGAARRVLDDGDLRRLAVAVAVAALSGAAVTPKLLAVAAVGAPSVLALDGIDLGLRKAAARALVQVAVPRHENPLPLLARARVLASGDGFDVEAVAGVLRLCSERGYERLRASCAFEALATSFSLSPSAALLSTPPTSPADRRDYLELLDWIAVEWRRHAPRASDVAWIAVSLPYDGGKLLEGLDLIAPGTTLAVAAAVVDLLPGAAAAGGAIEERRLQRACDLLAGHLDLRGAASLLRVVATSRTTSGDASLGRGARAVVRAVSRAFVLNDVADIVDGMTEAHRAALLPVLLDEAPRDHRSVKPSSSRSLALLLARDAVVPVVALSDEERGVLDVIADAHFGKAALDVAAGRAVSGLADVVVKRRSVPRSVDGCAAVLASAESVAVVARAAALLLPDPTSMEREAVRWLLRDRFVPKTLPPAARWFLVDDPLAGPTVGLQVEREVREAPGGLKAMIELALSLPAPVDGALWNALTTVVRKLAHVDKDACAALVDARAIALLKDLARGDVALLPAAGEAFLAVALPPQKEEAPKKKPPTDPTWEAWTSEKTEALQALLSSSNAGEQRRLVRGALLIGLVPPERLLFALGKVSSLVRAQLVLEALRVVDGAAVLSPLVKLLPLRLSTLTTVDRLRDLFSWGARQSIAVTGRALGLSLIGDSLGYTRLKGSRIFVNPLPLLLGEEGGVDVVKGLVVHELGHHRYHGGPEGLAVWEAAGKEKLHKLLNLVADEHLERNLRAMGPRFGHPLKILAAHAFQHMQKEVDVDVVVQAMGRRAFAVFLEKRLGVARRPGCVVLDVGAALAVLEQQGSSFARFMRALRMGLGDRYDDAKVRAGLALFSGKQFRASDMNQLMVITRKLRDIFQDETKLLDAFDLHQLTDASPDDVVGDGAVDVDDLGRAVEEPEQRTRIKGKPPRSSRSGKFSPGRVLNEDDDDSFDDITNIERVVYDATQQRALGDQVRRHATRLRQTLLDLGKNLVVERRRLAGRRLDRGALSGALLRGDPHLLVSRRVLPAADIFIGVVIDCSGSMDGDNLDRARLFGAVIAEAARGLRGVDARFFGFTDEVIHDAGDARRCAVASLVADGGNNDAAALSHVAQVARRSRRKTRLLVMISDGSPTECSVEALSGLVAKLTRQGFLCAQVAVQPLDDICFPHYVLLDGDDVAGAVRAFAAVVERLVLLGTGQRK